MAPEIPGSLARAPETVADRRIELRGSIEVDTGLSLFGTRDSLKSAMAPGAVKYKCVETGLKYLTLEILEVCDSVRDSRKPVH